MPTIRDVARRAGVAPITVSRVVNSSGYVSPETRRRVEEAIEALGYVPNSVARSLRSKQTRTIALVLTDMTNPFWTLVARGAEDAASQGNFNLILCNTDESEEKQARYLNVLLEKQVDGILLVPAQSRPEPVRLLQQQGVEVVVLDRRVPEVQVDTVRCDSVAAARDLTRHLLGLGHRRIAILSGPPDVSTAADRVTGYRQALEEAGVPVDERLVLFGGFNQGAGFQMMRTVLSTSPRPTAVLAANNFIAIGAFRALREAGLAVPVDISLAAFDDLPATLVLEPFLTVVAQPAYSMGRQAAARLLSRLGGEAGPPQEILLPAEIIVRRSTAPPG